MFNGEVNSFMEIAASYSRVTAETFINFESYSGEMSSSGYGDSFGHKYFLHEYFLNKGLAGNDYPKDTC